MNQKYVLGDVVSKRKNLGFTKGREDTIEATMMTQSHADLHQLMIQIATFEVEEQESIGNPYNRIVVDGVEDRSILQVKKNVTITFGNTFEKILMRYVERVLANQLRGEKIQKMIRHNGSGWDIVSNPYLSVSDFEWVFYAKKGASPVKLGGAQDITNMQSGAILVLRPRQGKGIETASWLNHAYVQGGINLQKPNKTRKKTLRPGFMGRTAQRVTSAKRFRAYIVRAGYQNKGAASRGETWRYGTPYLSIIAQPSVKGKRGRVI